jgi:hypothetical protein
MWKATGRHVPVTHTDIVLGEALSTCTDTSEAQAKFTDVSAGGAASK